MSKFRELANALKDESPKLNRSALSSTKPLAFLLGSAKTTLQPRSPDNVSKSVLNNDINDVIFADQTSVIDFRRELKNCVINIYNPRKVIFGSGSLDKTTESEKREGELEESRRGRGAIMAALTKKRAIFGPGKTIKDDADSDSADPDVAGPGLIKTIMDFAVTNPLTTLGLIGAGGPTTTSIFTRMFKRFTPQGMQTFFSRMLLGKEGSMRRRLFDSKLITTIRQQMTITPDLRPGATRPSAGTLARHTERALERNILGRLGNTRFGKTVDLFAKGARRFLINPLTIAGEVGFLALEAHVNEVLAEIQQMHDDYYAGQLKNAERTRASQFLESFNHTHPALYHKTTAKILRKLQQDIESRIKELQDEINASFSGKSGTSRSKEEVDQLRAEIQALKNYEPEMMYKLERPESSSSMTLNVPITKKANGPDFSNLAAMHDGLSKLKMQDRKLRVGSGRIFEGPGLRIVGFNEQRIVPTETDPTKTGMLFGGPETEIIRTPIFEETPGRRSGINMGDEVGFFPGPNGALFPFPLNITPAEENVTRTHEFMTKPPVPSKEQDKQGAAIGPPDPTLNPFNNTRSNLRGDDIYGFIQ